MTDTAEPVAPDHAALLQALVERGASDLHCKAGSPPAVRVSGELIRDLQHPVLGQTFTPATVALLAQSLLTTEQQQALLRDGSVVATHAAPGVGRFRVAVFRQRGSVAIVVHAVPQQVRPLDELGLPASVATLASAERGLVLVASPVGNGATTTLAAMVDHVNRTRACHVVTVEDPAEVLHRDDRSLDASTLDLLRQHQLRCRELALRVGVRLDDDAFLFSEEPDFATPWRPDVCTNRFGRLRATLGLESVRLHDLRHFTATELGQSGTPVATISARLGHHDKATTLNIYSHTLPATDALAAETISRLIGDPRRQHGS